MKIGSQTLVIVELMVIAMAIKLKENLFSNTDFETCVSKTILTE